MGFAYPLNISGSSQALVVEPGILRGYSLCETNNATAKLRLWDNASSAAGTLLDTVTFSAGQSTSDLHSGIVFANGLYVEIVSGAIEGSMRVG